MRIILSILLATFLFFTGNCPLAAVPDSEMMAGFARVAITPPLGTPMTGFGGRDFDPRGVQGIHDDLYARALYLRQDGLDALIMGFDLLFLSRDESDRFKGAIGRMLDLAPRQILLNTSHTHSGPKVGTWFYTPSDPLYLEQLEKAVLQAATRARDSLEAVTIWAGVTNTAVPMSRRKKTAGGTIEFAPDPKGTVLADLPICLLKNRKGGPLCLLFSVSCHPSTIKGDERSFFISADYPGAAMEKLDHTFGGSVSLFLQGAGGDAKASVIGKGEQAWRAGTWEDVDRAGGMIANEITAAIAGGLTAVPPGLRCYLTEMELPLARPPDRQTLEGVMAKPEAHSESMPDVKRIWAKEQLSRLQRGYALRQTVSILVHGLRLGRGLRLVGIEAELVAELGHLVRDAYPSGVTFPLGYTDGAQLYLVSSPMLKEGGYEPESYWEYRQPAPLAGGHELILQKTIRDLQLHGID